MNFVGSQSTSPAMDGSSTEQVRPVVLVVEDDPDLADLYTASLEDAFTVQTACDGQEAIKLLSDEIDVVVLDRRMPNVTGDEVLTQIRAAGCSCFVIMASAVDRDSEPLDASFDDYLTKPISPIELRERIERLL